MSEVKTAAAWGDTYATDVDGVIILELDDDIEMTIPYSDKRVPVTIVHGASESDILAGLSLLAKSREVCEYTSGDFGSVEVYYPLNHDRDHIPTFELPHFCPIEGCGRRVVVKEGSGK